jgi:hypothetical protein
MTDAFAPDAPAPTPHVVAAQPPLPKQISVLIAELADEKTLDLGTFHGVNLASVQVMAVIADQLAALAVAASQTKKVEFDAATIDGLATPMSTGLTGIANGLTSLATAMGQTKIVELAPTTIHKLAESLSRMRFGKVEEDVHIHETIVETSAFVDQTDTASKGVKITELDESIEAKPPRQSPGRGRAGSTGRKSLRSSASHGPRTKIS